MNKNLKEHIIAYVFFTVIVVIAIVLVIDGNITSVKRELDKPKVENNISEETPASTPTQIHAPQKEEVLAMRAIVLDGMLEKDVDALCSIVKKANRTIEKNIIYNNLIQKLSDPENLWWNSFSQTGEIQIGWAYSGDISKTDIMQEENLSENEFYEKYGEQVIMHNAYNAEDFAKMLEQCRDTVIDDTLRNDLQYVIDEVRRAVETHDVTHVENFYHVLHDMDYFLLNYRLDAEGRYIRDKSTITKYYGTLSVYDKTDN